MIFKQADQIVGLKQPPKTQSRRVGFPYELLRQLRKFGWSYLGNKWVAAWAWKDILSRYPISGKDIVEANRILAEHVVTLPVQPGRGKKSEGRIRVKTIRRERLGDIGLEDVFAEGVAYQIPPSEEWLMVPNIGVARQLYAELWERCGGNWEQDQNDDVWVLEFEKGSGL